MTASRSLGFAAASLAAPLAIGTAVARLSGSRRSGVIAGTITAAAFAAVRWQLARWFTQQPPYEVERRLGDLELRRYPAYVEARTKVPEPHFEEAIDAGFRRLARYIFGENKGAAAFAMVDSPGERLAMTTPVMAHRETGAHVVAFVMPTEKTLVTLPVPDDSGIELVQVPARRIAALRFRGRYTTANIREHGLKLEALVRKAGLAVRGEPSFAGYDPPTTLPFLRRAEMWVAIDDAPTNRA